ncbi:MAG: CoA transferase [Bradyrhizobium sp.]|uniref:CaiB/BaiF CoA transferase family protein n=1 Tax=Bradyrhizobium sp. TaxID=376 RepID=UPI001DCA43C3|nr:CaiB/BaiF CoA-transferase family protein [Bradyrhizobium sp.]MBV9560343.1 CoA transferase [Bradyrhizobium sp.]
MAEADNVQQGARRRGPLEGVRVIDIASFLAGPIGAMFLADFGADVIKIERPDTGDESRYWGNARNGIGLYYKVLNRNKRSVTADLRTPLGVEIVKRLVKTADILIENFRPGTLERWGLGWDVLSAINPALVMVRITGFGQTGPNAPRPGFGTLAEAYSGFAYINGTPELPPILPGFGLADSTAGLTGAYLAMVALKGREVNGGRGQYIDLALYEPLFTLLGPQAVDFDQLGLVQERNGSYHSFTSPRNCYRSRDGKYVAIAGASQSTFERMCVALGVPDLPADPRFKDNRLRVVNNRVLDPILAKAVENFTLDELMEKFIACEAAAAPVNNIAQIFEEPHFKARGNVVTVEDEELGGPVRFQNVVGKLSETPGEVRHAGPRLGSSNREILIEELGFSEAELGEASKPKPGSRTAAS